MEVLDHKERLARLLAEDEIYRAYADSARELEADYDRIAAALPPEAQRVLTGYRQCRELMALRAMEIVSADN